MHHADFGFVAGTCSVLKDSFGLQLKADSKILA
jgi:hypothetical protein